MAKIEVFKLAVERIKKLRKDFDSVTVGFSAGKDSTVLLAAAIEAADGEKVVAFFLDGEAHDPFTEAQLRAVGDHPQVELLRFCFPTVNENQCAIDIADRYWQPWLPADKDKWIWPFPKHGVKPPPEIDFTAPEAARWGTLGLTPEWLLWPEAIWGRRCELVGIRADESPRRRRLLGVYDRGFATRWFKDCPDRPKLGLAAPIAEMSTADIWHAHGKYCYPIGIPENGWYRFCQKRLEGQAPRVTTGFTTIDPRILDYLGRDFPDWWERMMNRVPGARTAARYGDTPLFGRGYGKDKVPENLDWPKVIADLIARQPERSRKALSQLVRVSVSHHRAFTTEPIPVNTPHKISGISWRGLHSKVIRPQGVIDPQVLTRGRDRRAWLAAQSKTAGRRDGFAGWERKRKRKAQ